MATPTVSQALWLVLEYTISCDGHDHPVGRLYHHRFRDTHAKAPLVHKWQSWESEPCPLTKTWASPG